MRSLVFSGLRIPEVNNVEDSLWQGRETNTGPIVNILVDRGNSGVGVVDWSLNPCLSLIKGKNLRLESLLGNITGSSECLLIQGIRFRSLATGTVHDFRDN